MREWHLHLAGFRSAAQKINLKQTELFLALVCDPNPHVTKSVLDNLLRKAIKHETGRQL